jgi:hypothetical protein
VIASTISFSNSIFEHTNSPRSPFLRHEVCGNLSIVNCSFITNTHAEFFLTNCKSLTIIANSSFYDNFGAIFASSYKAALQFHSSNVTESSSMESPLFYILRSRAVFKRCSFENNFAPDLILVRGASSASVRDCLFARNKPTHAVIAASNAASVSVVEATFADTQARDAVLALDANARGRDERPLPPQLGPGAAPSHGLRGRLAVRVQPQRRRRPARGRVEHQRTEDVVLQLR